MKTTNNTSLKEMELNELEEVNGGCFWCIGGLVSTGLWLAGAGYLYYLAHKDD